MARRTNDPAELISETIVRWKFLPRRLPRATDSTALHKTLFFDESAAVMKSFSFDACHGTAKQLWPHGPKWVILDPSGPGFQELVEVEHLSSALSKNPKFFISA